MEKLSSVHAIATRKMRSRWRRPVCILAVVFIAGLLIFDAMAHFSSADKNHVEADTPRIRARRSADSTTTSTNVRNETPVPNGAIYTRWGRKDCPTSAQVVYTGIMGSGLNTHTGGGGQYVCLTDEPQYLTSSGSTSYSAMYGVEYKTNYVGMSSGQNAVCVVCQSTRQSKVMIPGTYTCIDGWNREYYGYLMSSRVSEKSTRNYVCVDKEAQADWASNRGDGGGTLWAVGGSCGALPCPKYQSSRYITCVVCTR